MRDTTTNWANSLNSVYETISTQNKTSYKNFDIHLVKVNWRTLINSYVQTGGKAIDIIDRVDGFHPSTFGSMLLAQVSNSFFRAFSLVSNNDFLYVFQTIYEDIATRVPHWLPPVNPNNDKIRAKFGNQGGY